MLFIAAFFSYSVMSQEAPWKNGYGFNSVFQNLDSGSFCGTINGELFIKKEQKEFIINFYDNNGMLNIIKDSDEVYDVSTKEYTGISTHGKVEVKYKTYGSANSIGLNISGQWFELSFIDGGCDNVIDGLDYFYKTEQNTESLVLVVSKELVLCNWQYLLRERRNKKSDDLNRLQLKRKFIKILPKSTITIQIKR